MKLVAVILVVIIVDGCYGKKSEIKKTGLEGQPMPFIELLAADSITHFNTKSITAGKATILFAFEPWCPYCRVQTASLVSQIEKLKDINIYMMCTSPYGEFKKFHEKYGLEKYPNIRAGIDYKMDFPLYFKQTSVPCLAIYGPDKKLKQLMLGKTYISTIKEAVIN